MAADVIAKLEGSMLLLAGLAAIALGLYAYRKGPEALAAAGNAINPLNPENVFASGVNNVGAGLTGNKDWSLGGAFFDFMNPDAGLAPGETKRPGGVIVPAKKQPEQLAGWDQYGVPTF